MERIREKLDTCIEIYKGGISTWSKDQMFLEDTYGNPIEVSRHTFLIRAQQHYQMVMNTWHIQHDEIKRARKV